jgi:hypothetical protein
MATIGISLILRGASLIVNTNGKSLVNQGFLVGMAEKYTSMYFRLRVIS